MCMELLGVEGIGSLLYVDDIVAIFPPKEVVFNVMHVVLPIYKRMTCARFNLNPQKTAVMCCYGADPPDIQDMQCSVYKVLDYFFDEQLILNNQDLFVLNVGKALFTELLNLSNECGFPPPVVAVGVIQRNESVILYGYELFATKPKIYAKLDTLQGSWARQILGFSGQYNFRAALSVAFCGWCQRLGSKAIGRTIMYLAKIQLLPIEHPITRMVLISVSIIDDIWVNSAKKLIFIFQFLFLVSLNLDLFPIMISLVHVVMQNNAKFS